MGGGLTDGVHGPLKKSPAGPGSIHDLDDRPPPESAPAGGGGFQWYYIQYVGACCYMYLDGLVDGQMGRQRIELGGPRAFGSCRVFRMLSRHWRKAVGSHRRRLLQDSVSSKICPA